MRQHLTNFDAFALEVANADRENANESFICLNGGLYQIRKAEIRQQDESFCDENQNNIIKP